MRLTLKNTENYINERLHIYKKDVPCQDSSWHYHPQFELIYLSQSSGIRFVGDSVSQFFPGDLVLVGSYLPHLWRNNSSYFSGQSTEEVNTIVMKFMKNFIGKETFENTEFLSIHNMFEDSKFGISFGEDIRSELHDDLMQITELSSPEQSILLLKILYKLSVTNDKILLSSTDMRQYSTGKSDRLDLVIKYISDNYPSELNLKEIADVAHMTTNSFCRFFKKKTNKSFTQFLNEVRIRNAARLLVQENIPVSEVCFKVGYQSMTNFYRQFKQITGTTPRSHRQKSLAKL